MSVYDHGEMLKHIYLLGDRDTRAITYCELDAAIRLLPYGVRSRWVGADTGFELLLTTDRRIDALKRGLITREVP